MSAIAEFSQKQSDLQKARYNGHSEEVLFGGQRD